MTEDRFHPCTCAVCMRPAIGIGYAPRNARSYAQIAWLCDDAECHDIIAQSYSMKQMEFQRLDAIACHKAGDAAGQYLDEIGKTDLAQLTQEEWFKFLETVVGQYRTLLRTELENEAPF